ncbi:MAG TPA: hypothetical protein VHN11_14415 [Xanthobacteraceae bacterium]|jgi:hypothetical protein|nr:hypothetical protein [Xanthobacteraceae bacterium]
MLGNFLLALAAMMSFVLWVGEEWMMIAGLIITGSICAGAAIAQFLAWFILAYG